MSYVIGFDLGTHQTKICVQDASNPAEKTYKFFDFVLPDGTISHLFPSLVQVNRDHTVRYGAIEEDDCLVIGGNAGARPQLALTVELPPFVAPKRPKVTNYPPKPKFDPWIDSLKKLKGQKTDLDLWKEECAKIDAKAEREWQKQCDQQRAQYNKDAATIRSENDAIRKQYQAALAQWEKDSKEEKLLFRYFKLHAFTGEGVWEHNSIKSDDVSVWYITYILCLLREEYGDDFVVQFGVPCGATGTQIDKNITRRAYRIYIAAADLLEHFDSIDSFLATPYEELLQLTKYKKITEDVIDQYYFDDIPEAFAGLVAVTLQKKLDRGFHLLVDIGGGTTDLALFCIPENQVPDVLYVTSFPNGINSILQQASQQHGIEIPHLQQAFLNNPSHKYFQKAIPLYKQKLLAKGQHIADTIDRAFLSSYSHHGRKISELHNALDDQPVIFGGGGGAFQELHTPMQRFNDIRRIDKSMLSIRNLLTHDINDQQFTILATSYGLASYEKDPYSGGIKCTHISRAFQTFLPQKRQHTTSHTGYEHGLTDM